MEVYKRETREIVRRFLSHQLSSPIPSLLWMLRLLARLQADQLDEVRVIMLANNETVMEEMARRGQQKDA